MKDSLIYKSIYMTVFFFLISKKEVLENVIQKTFQICKQLSTKSSPPPHTHTSQLQETNIIQKEINMIRIQRHLSHDVSEHRNAPLNQPSHRSCYLRNFFQFVQTEVVERSFKVFFYAFFLSTVYISLLPLSTEGQIFREFQSNALEWI